MNEWDDDQYLALVSETADTCCLARSPDGYVCSEEPGHDGWHRAELEDNGVAEIIDVWPPKEI
jgi:hypothetical protein